MTMRLGQVSMRVPSQSRLVSSIVVKLEAANGVRSPRPPDLLREQPIYHNRCCVSGEADTAVSRLLAVLRQSTCAVKP